MITAKYPIPENEVTVSISDVKKDDVKYSTISTKDFFLTFVIIGYATISPNVKNNDPQFYKGLRHHMIQRS